MKSFDVVTFGESLVVMNADPGRPLRFGDRAEITFAGAESNVAVGLARLGHRVRFQTVLGRDRFGRMIRDALRGEGVDVDDAVFSSAGNTAFMMKFYSSYAEPDVLYYRGTSAFALGGPDDFPIAAGKQARVLYFTGITPALAPRWAEWCLKAAAEAHQRGVSVWFDPNYRRKLWNEDEARAWYLEVLPSLDVLLCGQSEGRLITGEEAPGAIARALQARTSAEVVVRAGREGATVLAKNGVNHSAPGLAITVVDPIGAGDAFAVGYLSAWLDGSGPPDRLARGNAIGAMGCLNRGDWEGLPGREELARFMASNTESSR